MTWWLLTSSLQSQPLRRSRPEERESGIFHWARSRPGSAAHSLAPLSLSSQLSSLKSPIKLSYVTLLLPQVTAMVTVSLMSHDDMCQCPLLVTVSVWLLTLVTVSVCAARAGRAAPPAWPGRASFSDQILSPSLALSPACITVLHLSQDRSVCCQWHQCPHREIAKEARIYWAALCRLCSTGLVIYSSSL